MQLSIENVSMFSLFASTFNCSIAAGLCKSAAINNDFLLLFFKKRASLTHVVVFPEPCKPAIRTIVCDWFEKLISSAEPP